MKQYLVTIWQGDNKRHFEAKAVSAKALRKQYAGQRVTVERVVDFMGFLGE